MTNLKWQLPLTLVFFISGILLAVTLRTISASDQNPWRQRNENLVAMIETQEKIIANLEKSIEENRAYLDRCQQELAAGKKELETLQERLRQLKVWAGLTEAKGPGIIVTLDDNREGAEAAQAANPTQFKPEDYLIHDKHLLYIINDLRVGGAEAISVNDQRIVTSSDIRCVGPMILVNTTRLAPPYTIKAIGNPQELMEILEQPESEYSILKMAGFPVSLEAKEEVVIPPYKGGYQFTYTEAKEE
ncbi:MAG: Uncharacterized protein XD63_1371 [Thermoanaerobacterales bacterium 50_218]|nr:MAG: Uncharacterized protein XD63_1371 [Thermoanaerobacterales bacterium 50_218]HAA90085.1 hypothetical protein [Peptococcaceae bacterium]